MEKFKGSRLVFLCLVFSILFGNIIGAYGAYDPMEVNWEMDLDVMNENFGGIAYNDEIYVAVGRKGIIKTSYDAKKWTYVDSPSQEDLDAVIWGGDQFIAAGKNDTILTSPDGFVWRVEDDFYGDPIV